jgi:two-component system phosphate regulon sensor histidine kinase PhoR
LLEEAVESTQPLRTQKNQQVSVDISPDLPAVQADREKIRQVLLNLLDNAYKFTHESGNIRIRVSHSPGEKTLEVHILDDGVGIPSLDLPRIFERFYRVDKARSRELGGTGLGLAIVKHIVEAHRGKVGVKSQLGQGSDFWLQLPIIS